jgi:FKBP-type peptidyl-prolyl cis-trans isomerase
MADSATAAAGGGATGRWIAAAIVVLAVVALLVWAGTRTAVDAARQSAPSAADLAYLSAHKDKPGVHTTASGLQYEILTEGTGPKPTAADTVTVHYEGRLLDGTVFDSSIARGTPATFPLANVIPGWTEGVALMPVGSTYRFTIPPDLGYGARGAGGVIPPNAVLVFEVQLLGIEGK